MSAQQIEALLIDGWKRDIIRLVLENDQELFRRLLRCAELDRCDIWAQPGNRGWRYFLREHRSFPDHINENGHFPFGWVWKGGPS